MHEHLHHTVTVGCVAQTELEKKALLKYYEPTRQNVNAKSTHKPHKTKSSGKNAHTTPISLYTKTVGQFIGVYCLFFSFRFTPLSRSRFEIAKYSVFFACVRIKFHSTTAKLELIFVHICIFTNCAHQPDAIVLVHVFGYV